MKILNGRGRLVSVYVVSVALEKLTKPDKELDVDLGDTKVEIHIPTYNEEGYITDTLESLHNQELVENGEVELVLVDSKSEDRTREIAKGYVDRIILTPRGKLTARNKAAEVSNADIMVYVDAGDIYPKGWLNHMLKPFENSNVVAVHGPQFYRSNVYRAFDLARNIRLLSKLNANNEALRREAFLDTGGFDETIDQTDKNEMIKEEEYRLMDRMKAVGEVVLSPKAQVKVTTRNMPLSAQKTERYKRDIELNKRF